MWLTNRSKRMPPYRKIVPWVYWSCWCFAIINLFFLSPGFFIGAGATGLALVSIPPQTVWGVVFIFLGILMGYALLSNRWKFIKRIIVAGLFLKSLFAWGLVLTLPTSYKNPGVIGIWLGLMCWQALCIIYFTPEIRDGFDN